MEEFRSPAPVASGASFGVSSVFAKKAPTSDLSHATSVAEGTTRPRAREFFLTADKSFADHQSNLERLSYYWGFPASTRSFAYDDLAKSVPLEGLATISADPDMLPNRIVKLRAAQVAKRKTLRQIQLEARIT